MKEGKMLPVLVKPIYFMYNPGYDITILKIKY